MGPAEKLCDEVNGFCYLGDKLNASGGCEITATSRTVLPLLSHPPLVIRTVLPLFHSTLLKVGGIAPWRRFWWSRARTKQKGR